jgi:hypothetical protein
MAAAMLAQADVVLALLFKLALLLTASILMTTALLALRHLLLVVEVPALFAVVLTSVTLVFPTMAPLNALSPPSQPLARPAMMLRIAVVALLLAQTALIATMPKFLVSPRLSHAMKPLDNAPLVVPRFLPLALLRLLP